MAVHAPWPIGQIPDDVLIRLGRVLVHRIAMGEKDISGDNYGDLLAYALDGDHLSKPEGVVDIVRNGCAWSAKTLKKPQPHNIIGKRVRLISGRNSVDFSFDVSDAKKDIQATGRMVISIWNQRVNESRDKYDDLRIMALVRNMETQEFLLFEEEVSRFSVDNYVWKPYQHSARTNENLWGYDKNTDEHCFVWQIHGGQFTIKRPVPASARRFFINRSIIKIDREAVWNAISYEDEWITIVG